MINTTNNKNVTEGPIYIGEKSINSCIVVTPCISEPNKNDVNQKGTITADKLMGPMEGKTISDLVAAMKNGSTYADIQ
jgi:hypothetical protein